MDEYTVVLKAYDSRTELKYSTWHSKPNQSQKDFQLKKNGRKQVLSECIFMSNIKMAKCNKLIYFANWTMRILLFSVSFSGDDKTTKKNGRNIGPTKLNRAVFFYLFFFFFKRRIIFPVYARPMLGKSF